jgi:hypothetical protein
MASEINEKLNRQNYKIIRLSKKEMTNMICNLFTNLTNVNYSSTTLVPPTVDVWDSGKYLYTLVLQIENEGE